MSLAVKLPAMKKQSEETPAGVVVQYSVVWCGIVLYSVVMDGCMHGCMDAWMHGCMDAWMDAWMDG